jgi:hypothetical protein
VTKGVAFSIWDKDLHPCHPCHPYLLSKSKERDIYSYKQQREIEGAQGDKGDTYD